MNKKTTNTEMKEIIRKILEDFHKDMNEKFKTAQRQMSIAENDLVDTFNEKQKELYSIYCEKREEFYKIAEELYEKKF